MIDCVTKSGNSSILEIEVPVNPGRAVRLLALQADVANDDGVEAHAAVVALAHKQGAVWTAQTDNVNPADLAVLYVSFNGGQPVSWLNGTERQQFLVAPTSPWWDDDDRPRVTVSMPNGRVTNMKVWLIFSRVPRTGDMTRALE